MNQQKSKNGIGACGFNNWDQKAKKAELGFWLLPEFRGMGYIGEALSEVLGYGFDSMGLERIRAEVERANTVSIRLLNRLGFTRQIEKSFTEIKNKQSIVVDIYELAGSSPD